MKKTKKALRKLTAVLLSALLLTSVPAFHVSSYAAETADNEVGATSGTTGDCTWTIDENGVLTVSGEGRMADYSFEGSPWFSNTGLKSVIIEDGVTNIGNHAFQSYEPRYALKSVTMADSVTDIGERAFGNCCSLPEIILSSSLQSIGMSAFAGCSKLTELWIPASVTFIDTDLGYNPFVGCSGLDSIAVDSANPVYDSRNNCNAIIETENNKLVCGFASTTIPDTVTEIGRSAFYGMDKLTHITIPDSVVSIGDSAFHSCDKLEEIKLSRNVTSIELETFRECSALREITIPDNVAFIGRHAFYKCPALKSVTIPSSVVRIGEQAFGYYENNPFPILFVDDDDENPYRYDECYLKKVDGFVIFGYKNSEAQRYANEKGFEFVAIHEGEHSYGEPVWTWDGYSAATATFTCTDCDDTQVENATVTTKITKAPTCTETGIRTCTATVTFNGNTYTDTKEKTVPAKHSYDEPVWTWDGYSAATANFTCSECGDTQIKNATVTTKITKEPTCTETGIRTCTAKVTLAGKTYTDTKEKTVPATGHSYGKPTWTWSGYSAATASFTCAECDDTQVKKATVKTKVTKAPTCSETGIRTCTATVTFKGITYTDTKEKTIPAVHSYGEPTWTWNGYSSATATFICADCDNTQVKNAKVTTKVTKEPTATETGIRTCTATITFNGSTYTDTKLKVIPKVAQSSENPGLRGEYPDDEFAAGVVPFYIMGDANGDGVADIRDVTAIQYHLAGIKNLDNVGMYVSDVDADEEVTVDDATEVQFYLSCFDYTYPIGDQVLIND